MNELPLGEPQTEGDSMKNHYAKSWSATSKSFRLPWAAPKAWNQLATLWFDRCCGAGWHCGCRLALPLLLGVFLVAPRQVPSRRFGDFDGCHLQFEHGGAGDGLKRQTFLLTRSGRSGGNGIPRLLRELLSAKCGHAAICKHQQLEDGEKRIAFVSQGFTGWMPFAILFSCSVNATVDSLSFWIFIFVACGNVESFLFYAAWLLNKFTSCTTKSWSNPRFHSTAEVLDRQDLAFPGLFSEGTRRIGWGIRGPRFYSLLSIPLDRLWIHLVSVFTKQRMYIAFTCVFDTSLPEAREHSFVWFFEKTNPEVSGLRLCAANGESLAAGAFAKHHQCCPLCQRVGEYHGDVGAQQGENKLVI